MIFLQNTVSYLLAFLLIFPHIFGTPNYKKILSTENAVPVVNSPESFRRKTEKYDRLDRSSNESFSRSTVLTRGTTALHSSRTLSKSNVSRTSRSSKISRNGPAPKSRKNTNQTYHVPEWLIIRKNLRSNETTPKISKTKVFDVIPPMKTRREIPMLLEEESLQVGAELGVQMGAYALMVLNHWRSCKKYYLIDCWRQQANYSDNANHGDMRQEDIFNESKRILQPYLHKVQYMKMYTSDAARLIPNSSLDFVYVDARHDYCGVKEDMELYWPKLRTGGIMAGHDYRSAPEVTVQDWSLCANGARVPGAVKAAVLEFSMQRGLQVSVTYEDPWPSWIIRKTSLN